jgi:hypothetical protein
MFLLGFQLEAQWLDVPLFIIKHETHDKRVSFNIDETSEPTRPSMNYIFDNAQRPIYVGYISPPISHLVP